jgi:hypothetical protein
MVAVLDRLRSPYAAFGVLCALGTQSDGLFGGIVFADVLIGLWAAWCLARHRAVPHIAVLLTLGAMLPGLLWTDDLFYSATLIGRMFALSVIATALLRRQRDVLTLSLGFAIGVAVQSLGLLATITVHRPPGLSENASQVSSTGLVLWMVSPLAGAGWFAVAGAALHMGIGLGRTALLAAGIFTLFALSKYRIAAFGAVLALAVLASVLQGDLARLIPGSDRMQGSVEIREAQFTDHGAEYTRATGMGWGSYLATTGEDRPHNVVLLAWYELGVLSLIPAGVLTWAVWRRRVPWMMLAPLVALGMLTEELTGRPEGAYMLATVAVAYLVSSARANRSLSPAVR